MLQELIEIILHTDDALLSIVSQNILQAYIVLFLLVMCETGFIIFPFLPGDGLVFSAGVVAAATEMNVGTLAVLLVSAAIMGNLINYITGKGIGSRINKSKNDFVKMHLLKHIPEVDKFYRKYGNRAIIVGRFFPVIRTYIPFLAGIVKVDFKAFAVYSLIGAAVWISVFLFSGYFIGEITWVKNNYGVIFLGLIIITLIPFLYALLKKTIKKFKKNR